MISRLLKAISKRVANWWRVAPLETRRGVGVSFDILCSSILCLIPFWVHGTFDGLLKGDFAEVHFLGWLLSLGENERPKTDVIQSILSHHYVALTCLFSPFPLLIMRLVCKCLIRTKTPGEMLGQYSNLFDQKRRLNWMRQAGVALSQYFLLNLIMPLVAFAMIPAMFLCFLLTIITTGTGILSFVIIPPLVGFYVIACFFRSFYTPAKKGSLLCGIDKLLGVDIVDLRIRKLSGQEQETNKLAIQP